MRKHAVRILTLLLLSCLMLQPARAHAAQTLDVARTCSLELEYFKDGMGFPGLEIRIYRIAQMYADGGYARVAPFDQFPVSIHGITSQKEWRDAANTLAAYIAAQQIDPIQIKMTDSQGNATFRDLQTGVYLVQGVTAERADAIYTFENFCVFLPRPETDGSYQYDHFAKPKSTVTPKPEKPEDVHFQVSKLWKDAGIRDQRPGSITVAILKNGIVQETVRLNAQNNWTYSWSAPKGKDIWTVVERDVPDEYNVVITVSGNAFTITNHRPAPQSVPPKTGDTFALRHWLTVMSLSGMTLLVCGLLQKRKHP